MKRLSLTICAFLLAASGAFAQTRTGPVEWSQINSAPITASGSTIARTLADRAADVVNVKDFGALGNGVADDTTAILAAKTYALTLGHPSVVYFPAGAYHISAAIPITTSAAQGVHLRGESSGSVIITQTADADGFQVSLTNYGGTYSTGAFSATGLTLRMGATSSTRTALSVTTTATTGTVGVPLVIDDVVLASPTSSSLWGVGINVGEISNVAYLSRISSVYNGTAAGTAVSINGNATSYSSSVFLKDSTFISGNIGLSLGNYLQGVHVSNQNTINTLYSVKSIPTAGVNVEIQISGSYLFGKFLLSPSGAASLNSVKLTDTYFDAGNLSASDLHVSIVGVPIATLIGNTFNGMVSAVANTVGLNIDGAGFNQIVSGNTFQAYGNGGIGVKLGASTSSIHLNGNVFKNNSTDVADSGSANTFVATTDSGGVFQMYGITGSIPTAAAPFNGPISSTGLITGAGVNTTAGLTFQGGSNVAGSIYTDANWGALIKGRSGSTADVAIQASGGTIGLEMNGSGNLIAPALATAGTIAGSMCATSAGVLLYESGASSCTISLASLKNINGPEPASDAWRALSALKPISFTMKPREGEQVDLHPRLGFTAENAQKADPRLATYDGNGKLQGYDPNGVLALLVATVQQQQREINGLKRHH